MTVLSTAGKPRAKKPIGAKPKTKKQPDNKPLELNMNYSVADAASVAGVSAITLWRAIAAGHLKTYRVGRRRVVSGEQIKHWLENGGKTSEKGVRKNG